MDLDAPPGTMERGRAIPVGPPVEIPSTGKGVGTMRLLRLLTATIVPILLVATASADCPVPGMWTTTNGSMIGGRASEAWCGAGGAPLQPGVPGNAQNAMSWDGGTLGTQWKVWGMTIDANGAAVSGSLDANGDGVLTYTTHYDGGQFWLTGAHAWSSGGGDLTGTISGYVVVATATIRNFVMVGMTSNVSFSGTFENCQGANCVIEFAIANAMWMGSGAVPSDYPPYLCGATEGEWFDACCATVVIDCTVDTRAETWGRIKSLYNN